MNCESSMANLSAGPRRPYDKAYSQFVYEAARLVSAPLTSLILHEKDIGRREKAITTAELIKTELRQRLAESQLEADRGHTKFQVGYICSVQRAACLLNDSN